MGWSLSATSGIHRCPKTVAQDGVSLGVQFEATDRLCLDGQRLIRITPPSTGEYWSTGSEYRTEIDSFVKVVLNGGGSGSNHANNTIWFTAYGKNNVTRTYAKPAATLVSSWMISEEVDQAGKDRNAYDQVPHGFVWLYRIPGKR